MIDINLLIAIGGILVAFFTLFFATRNGNREYDADEHERLKADAYKEGKIDSKLDDISNTVSRTDNNIQEIKKDISSINGRLTVVEQSTKSAHKRLDEHLKGDN